MIEAVRSKNNGGGFVKPYKNGQWYVVGDSLARERARAFVNDFTASTIRTPRPSAEKSRRATIKCVAKCSKNF
jgi:hypothetical protein